MFATLLVTVLACEIPPANDPSPQQGTRAQDPSEGRSCNLNSSLGAEERKQRAEEWMAIEASRRNLKKAGEGSEACSAVRTFIKECPRWELNAPNVMTELCQQKGHRECFEGTPLDQRDRRMRAEQWNTMLATRTNRTMGVSGACRIAKDFRVNCPAWDAKTDAYADELCSDAAKECAPGIPKEERKDAAKMILPGIEASFRMDFGLSGLKDPNDARKTIVSTERQVKLYKCYEPQKGEEMQAKFEAWSEETEKAIAEEIKCRASSVCMARRVADQVCALIEDKRDAAKQIVAEKRNPGGVVNLRTLHDLGERMQSDDAAIAEHKRDYADLAKRPFTEALCKQ